MATELIDGNTLKRVRGMLKHGKTGLLRDSACPGLAIRVNKGKATWVISARDWQDKIGDLDLFGSEDIATLREVVARARQMRKEGRDGADFLTAFIRERDVAMAAARTDVHHGIGENWEAVRDAFLAWCAEHRRPDTTRGYRSSLGAVEGGPIWHDFEPVRGKPIVTITTKDLVQVRTNVVKRGSRGSGDNLRQADLTVSALKACFKWYLNQPDSLIESSPAALLGKVMERKKVDEDEDVEQGRVMTQEEMGLYVWGLSFCKNPAARLASCLQAVTGQRRMTACRARKRQFIDHEQYGMVWRLGGSAEKTHAWRALPLPEFARGVVKDALIMTRADNAYLFPQQRERKAGSGMDGHLSERRVSKVIEDMRENGGPLANMPFLPSTHDLRRTMVSVIGPRMHRFTVDGRTLTRKDVEMITHVNEGREGTAALIYDKSEYFDVKYSILEDWQAWIMEGYAAVVKKLGEPGAATKRAA